MTRLALLVATVVAAALSAACGGRSSLGDPHDGQVACPVPTTFSSQSCRYSTARCLLTGVDPAGASYQLSCDGTGCSLKKNGVLTCTCSQLDWASSCPSGQPLCADWRLPFNWNTLECREE